LAGQVLEVKFEGIDQLSDKLKDIEKRLDGVDKELKKSSTQAKKTSGELQAVGGALKEIGKVAAAAAVAVTVAIAAMVKSAAEFGDALDKASKRTGFTVESLGGLKFAAEQSGTSFDKLIDGLKDFTKNSGEASRSSGPVRDAFNEIGVSVADIDSLSPEDLFNKVADGLADIEGEGARTATGMRILGESFFQLAPLLNDGSEGIKKYREELEGLNAVMTTEQAQIAAEMNDNIGRLKKSLEGFTFVALEGLGPVISDIAFELSELTSDPAAIEAFSDAMYQVGDAFAEVADIIASNRDTFTFAIRNAEDLAKFAIGVSTGNLGLVVRGGTGLAEEVIGESSDSITTGRERERAARSAERERRRKSRRLLADLDRIEKDEERQRLKRAAALTKQQEEQLALFQSTRGNPIVTEGTLFERALAFSAEASNKSNEVKLDHAGTQALGASNQSVVDLTQSVVGLVSSFQASLFEGESALEGFVDALYDTTRIIATQIQSEFITRAITEPVDQFENFVFGKPSIVDTLINKDGKTVAKGKNEIGSLVSAEVNEILGRGVDGTGTLDSMTRLAEMEGKSFSEALIEEMGLTKGSGVANVGGILGNGVLGTAASLFAPLAIGGLFGGLFGLFGKNKDQMQEENHEALQSIKRNTNEMATLMRAVNAPANLIQQNVGAVQYQTVGTQQYMDINS